MKNFLTAIIISVITVSCSKKEATSTTNAVDSTKIVDSINAARTKINDSIKSKNHFKDFSGTHKFTHNLIKGSGTIDFKKIDGEADHYDVSGNIKSGNNSLKIKGFMAVVSEKHINFTGEITQSITEDSNGKPYVRKKTTTFMSKDGGTTYRLQDMVNGSGFVDHIDIHF
ncbi:hypothetical protein SAMN05443633_11390 [Chryseobacterium arachidis]|uniref:Lipoprotein n=1 Tax=Chryseobacterium arachidis TaxID=1416778 RepID=A0A1M5IWZ0_9FLAO|nr:hypothetical protein [Chryseobacterium arachidis]SHG32635.1 hypothetical protein SAMN05443633_11390 [Chryseobacterium arachidis]